MAEQSHADHSHAGSSETDTRRLAVALALIVAFMAAEVAAGILAHSLALLSDAAHMLTDAGALGLSLVVIRLAAQPAKGDLTFGLKRTEILSAQANGATLLVLAGLIVYEGVHRLISPPQPEGTVILIVALVGILVNLAATWQLSKANRESMNVEGSFQHILTDLLAFIFTAIARRRDPDHRLHTRRRDRIPDRCRDHVPCGVRPAARLRARTAGSGTGRDECLGDRKRARPIPRCYRCSRPARVDDYLGFPLPLGARARPAR